MSKYRKIRSTDYERSGPVAVAAAGASYSVATTAAATVAVAGATAGIYYVSTAPVQAVVQASCAALPTCAALGFF